MSQRSSLSILAVLLLATFASLPYAAPAATAANVAQIVWADPMLNGHSDHIWQAPEGVFGVDVAACGGRGGAGPGDVGGLGALVTHRVYVSSGALYRIQVGGAGGNAWDGGDSYQGPGGLGGGGTGGFATGGGGGATIFSTIGGSPYVIAGGGGGGGAGNGDVGGTAAEGGTAAGGDGISRDTQNPDAGGKGGSGGVGGAGGAATNPDGAGSAGGARNGGAGNPDQPGGAGGGAGYGGGGGGGARGTGGAGGSYVHDFGVSGHNPTFAPGIECKDTDGWLRITFTSADTDQDGVLDAYDDNDNDPKRYTPGALSCYAHKGRDFDPDTDSDGCPDSLDTDDDGDGLLDDHYQAYAWGLAGHGQLGIGYSPTHMATPQPLDPKFQFKSITAGGQFTYAIGPDNSLWGWGRSDHGMLGTRIGDPVTKPIRLDLDFNWDSIDTTTRGSSSFGQQWSTTAAVKTNGDLYTWGDDQYGQLANGDTTGSTDTPTRVATGIDWEKVELGALHAVGKAKLGHIYGWGDNTFYQVAKQDTTADYHTPQTIASTTSVDIAAGAGSSFYIDTNGRIFAWGSDDGYALGNGDGGNHDSPVVIDQVYKSVEAAGSSTFGLKNDGKLLAWGYNDNGNLGLGHELSQPSPVQVGDKLWTWTMVAADYKSTYAIRSDGTLWSWGDNDGGRLGYPGLDTNVPTQIGTDDDWIHVDAYDGTVFAIRDVASQDACNGIGWTSTPATDFDGDGCRDATEDNDDDNDGVIDEYDRDGTDKTFDCSKIPTKGGDDDPDLDGCPNDQDPDRDGDGFSNDDDQELGVDCSYAAVTQQNNMDYDGCPDNIDPDIDGDGVANAADRDGDIDCKKLRATSINPDTDGDGCPDDPDTDDDNDLILDADDVDSFDASIDCSLLEGTTANDPDADGCPNDVDTDDDGDGVQDEFDNCPLDVNPQQENLDGDAQGDICDDDDDGDGVNDELDDDDNEKLQDTGDIDCSREPGTVDNDLDGDGCPNRADSDDDGDTVPDLTDNCVRVVNLDQADLDGDRIGDACDDDPDGDGHIIDAFPMDPAEWADSDGDNVGDNADFAPQDKDVSAAPPDHDSDKDGVVDTNDVFPNDASETVDTDGDGVGDNGDRYPDDPRASADTDGDKIPDACELTTGYTPPAGMDDICDNDGDGKPEATPDRFPRNPKESLDSDGDGVGDVRDTFPQDPKEWADSDEDGIGDNADDLPLDATATVDTDGDGHADTADLDLDGTFDDTPDAFPQDPKEWVDTDSDGVGDNGDPYPEDETRWGKIGEDDDGDGALNEADDFPADPTLVIDQDGDGVDAADDFDDNDPKAGASTADDTDGDGVPNLRDDLPLDPSDSKDADGDGVGDLTDPYPDDGTRFGAIGQDDDGDGVANERDLWPADPDRHTDQDGDGLHSLIDFDDTDKRVGLDSDGDGVPDVRDAFPDDDTKSLDTDGDEIHDGEDDDKDGDGVDNDVDACPLDPQESLDTDGDTVCDGNDAFPDDALAHTDTDGDGVADQYDFDDDGDTVPDAKDECEGVDDRTLRRDLLGNLIDEDNDGRSDDCGGQIITGTGAVYRMTTALGKKGQELVLPDDGKEPTGALDSTDFVRSSKGTLAKDVKDLKLSVTSRFVDKAKPVGEADLKDVNDRVKTAKTLYLEVNMEALIDGKKSTDPNEAFATLFLEVLVAKSYFDDNGLSPGASQFLAYGHGELKTPDKQPIVTHKIVDDVVEFSLEIRHFSTFVMVGAPAPSSGGGGGGAPCTDCDTDGMLDEMERELWGNLDQDGMGDFDGDGVSNADEIAAGTDPLMAPPQEAPEILVVEDPAEETPAPAAEDETSRGGMGWVPVLFLLVALGVVAYAFRDAIKEKMRRK